MMEDKDKLDRLITDEFKRLKIFRKSEGLTQVKMAEMLGKSQGNYTRWETGMYKIPVDIIKDLHRIFGLNLEWFYHGKGPKKVKIDERAGNQKNTLLQDISVLRENNEVLMNQMQQLQREFKKLHAEFHEYKQQNRLTN